MMGSVVIVGASLAGMHAAHTLRRQGFDGRITVVDADPNTPYDKPPLSKQVLAGELGAGPHRAARGRRGPRPRPPAGPAGHGPRPGRPLRAPRRRRAAGLRRPGPGHRRRGPAPARVPSRWRACTCCARSTTAWRLRGELDRRPEPGGGGRRRVHRRRGGRHLPRTGAGGDAAGGGRRAPGAGPGRARSARSWPDLHRDHGVDVRLGRRRRRAGGDRPGHRGAPGRRRA